MKYIKVTCTNGYAGCDEEWFEEVEDDFNIYSDCTEWIDAYAFAEPDDRFLDYETDEEYEEAVEEYQNNIECWIEEVSKEEYEENT